jgi:hypothetical protein
MNTILHLPPRSAVAAGVSRRERNADAVRTDGLYVVYTTPDETLAAVRAAVAFARPQGIPVTLVHFWTRPYGQAIDAPCGISPIAADTFVERLATEGLVVRPHVYACRDSNAAIADALPRRSLVFVGGRRRWRTTMSERSRRALEAAGHLVVLVDTSHVRENAHA